ncbi:MAG: stage V sporulation protein AA [Lachnospiraceae bacterium]|nr:stage V sporulation protein AA [Robinsoniella sp.]MDY3767892.1 stage V sporulation protein AA [Lachnospiraceae bacterium]
MSRETVYMKFDQNVLTKKEKVFLKDIAEIISEKKELENKIKMLSLASGGNGKPGRYIHSVVEVIALVQESYPNVEIQVIGESDFIVTVEKSRQPPMAWEWTKTIAVAWLTFFGAAFCIMTFNNDVDLPKLFQQLFEQFTGKVSDGFTILEIAYSVGVGLGILIFFNHFGRKKFTSDPTPLEVQMRSYEDDINTTLIETDGRKEKS